MCCVVGARDAWLMRTSSSSRELSARGLELSDCEKPSLIRKVYALKGSHNTDAAAHTV